jgi:hypothetical protein
MLICFDGVFDILDGSFKGIALAMASGEGRTMNIKTVFAFVYNNSIFHNSNLPYA